MCSFVIEGFNRTMIETVSTACCHENKSKVHSISFPDKADAVWSFMPAVFHYHVKSPSYWTILGSLPKNTANPSFLECFAPS